MPAAQVEYVFAAAKLAVLELGYPPGEITLKPIDLVAGAHYDLAFLKLNPNGTIPILELAGDAVYNTTADVISYLVLHAPVKVKTGSAAFIDAVHAAQYDPNFAMFCCGRDTAELSAKGQGLQGTLLATRQIVLEKYLADPAAAQYKSFYENRLATNGGLLAIFNTAVPAEV
ncbi:hypothetical protein DFH09DRAFT_1086087 [Mycena vulgaris]|nr:hypothetical protein DFH09DRAFT_1086087 [Mycena vulgaris]